MYFSVGIETPNDDTEAYSLVVPALCIGSYRCYSAADTENDIAAMATEAIQLMLETMKEDGFPVAELRDSGKLTYRQLADYQDCDNWLLLHVDVSAFMN
ncbi:type II toxin-antitoxin system HicB family antitoxin [Rheinheimera marina]|uniref:Type II toxin-antitoxin system HicB family antitoxin n=1 Tax=Rheinheimera marina TaxID=1774958 RepID=A0ABV9JI43_9GAMM